MNADKINVIIKQLRINGLSRQEAQDFRRSLSAELKSGLSGGIQVGVIPKLRIDLSQGGSPARMGRQAGQQIASALAAPTTRRAS